jgi:hypothetical protein
MIEKRRIVALLMATLITVFSTVLVEGPVSAAPPPASGSLTTSIMQVIAGVGTFTGTLTVSSFQLVDGAINAVGTINGTITNAAGATVGAVSGPITVPLASFTGTCTILTLNTGAINLSVLGLNVSLSPISLVITATAAPGNLLGNLLCSVANLLNSNGTLSALTGLLNQILGAIRV